jgi:hypothetical protein
MARPYLLLAFCAGLGALGYALLIRRFWIRELSYRATALIACGCVWVTLATFGVLAFLGHADGLSLAVAWWLAFSGGLWYQDVRMRGS